MITMKICKNPQPLELDFEVPQSLQRDIDDFLEYLRTDDTQSLEDCYRTEIDCELRWCLREAKISREQYQLLKDYYVHKGIYSITG